MPFPVAGMPHGPNCPFFFWPPPSGVELFADSWSETVQAFFDANAGLSPVKLLSGAFFAALQLAAPVLAATLMAEVTISALGKISPQLPVMIVAVPAKTLLGYTVLIGSLALWPRFIEARFSYLLDSAEQLIRRAAVVR